MATTTAKLTIVSNDLIDSQTLSLAASMAMKQAGVDTGITNTTGLARKTLATASTFTVLTSADHSSLKNHRLYMRCVGTTLTEYFDIKVDAVVLGILYSGDWCLLPYSSTASTDITATSSAAGMTLEYMFFYEA